MNGLYFADYAVITGFFGVMLAIGFYFRGRMKNMSDFFGAGKQVPWWLGGISFYMCSFSALGFVVYSALAYQYGFVAVTIYWLTVPAMILAAIFFATRWRKVAETSPLEYIEHRYSNSMRQALVWLGIPTRILDDALKLLAIGTVVAASVGFPLKTAIIISGFIIITYTFMGGLWAALIADVIQFSVKISAVLVLPILMLNKAGGLHNFVQKAPEGFFAFTTAKYDWGYLLIFFVIILLNYSSSWSLVQRYYSAKDDKNARKVAYFVAFLNFISPPIFYLPAMIARVAIPNIQNYNEVYAIICKTVLPVGMVGMVISAMFAATMSALAADYNAVASVLTNDVFNRMLSRKASGKSLMIIARLNTLLVGGIVIAFTFIIQKAQGSDDLFRIMVKIFGLFLPPVAIPMLAGMLTKRISQAGGLSGLILGILIGIISFAIGFAYPIFQNEQFISVLTSITTCLGMFGGTMIFPSTDNSNQKIQEFFAKIDNPDVHVKTNVNVDPSYLRVIGLGIFIIGLVLMTSVCISNIRALISIGVGIALMIAGSIFWLAYHRLSTKNISLQNNLKS